MKIYNVVETDHYNGNAPQEYRTNCKTFTDKSEAEAYKKELENKYEMRWCGPYNHVTIFTAHIKVTNKKSKVDFIWSTTLKSWVSTKQLDKDKEFLERVREKWNAVYFIDDSCKKVKCPF